MIAFGVRSYRVGDLMQPLPTAACLGKYGESSLVLIVREAGHPRYFYGVACSTGKEHLLSLENYVGAHETDGAFPTEKISRKKLELFKL